MLEVVLKKFRLLSESYTIHSDSIFGAVCHAYAQTHSEEALTEKLENGKIAVSSAFPRIKREEFIPVIDAESFIEPLDQKKLKKIKFIPIKSFEKNSFDFNEIFEKNKMLSNFEIESRPRIKVPRNIELGTDNRLFFSHEIINTENFELYFLIEGLDKNETEKVMNELKYSGFLGDKSTGNGIYEYEIFNQPEKFEKRKGSHFINLSLYSPKKEELTFFKEKHKENPAVSYKLISRAGFTETGIVPYYRKPRKFYFQEGSIFPSTEEKKLYGESKFYEKSEEFAGHKIYWNGITILFNVDLVVK